MILQIIESVLPMVGGSGSSIYHSWRFHFKILTTNKFFLGTRYLFYEISFSIFPLIEEQWTIAAWKYVCSDPLCCVYIKNVYISVKSFNSARYYISFSSFQVFHCIGENSPTHLNCSCLPAQVRKVLLEPAAPTAAILRFSLYAFYVIIFIFVLHHCNLSS